MRLSSLYECGCDDCKTKINLAADPKGKDFKSVLKAAENAFKHLHEKGGYKAEDINDKPYQKLISETNNVLSEGLRDNVIPPAMMAKMENDTFIFSGLKMHAQLLEANSFLRDEKGQIRSFDSFANEFNKVNEKYNQNYLEAEHSFAVRSSQMAANWAATDPDGRYNLQYRTANDDRVRENHRALQDITLPKEDSFWLSYYPPNGWRCRCTAVEVRKSKFEVSDSEKAIQAGEKATSQIGKDGKNKLEIFRFNPGAEQKVFPPKHPYNKVKDADEVKGILLNTEVLDKYKADGFEVKVYDNTGQDIWNENFSKFNISELTEKMNVLAKKNNIYFDVKRISFDEKGTYLEFIDTKKGVMIERFFTVDNENNKRVEHKYFELPKEMQGQGFSKEMFKIFHQQYKNAEIDKITVHANLDIGGYTWAKYGFHPIKPRDIENISDKCDTLFKTNEITDFEYSHFKKILKSYEENEVEYFDLNKIANTSYGKKLLIGADWRGEINMNEKSQIKIYEDYLFGR